MDLLEVRDTQLNVEHPHVIANMLDIPLTGRELKLDLQCVPIKYDSNFLILRTL